MNSQSDSSSDNQAGQANQSSFQNSAPSSSSSSLPSRSIQPSATNKSRQKKSSLSSFLNSVSETSSSATTAGAYCKSLVDEIILYRSLAIKEVQQMIDTGSNPDACQFWWVKLASSTTSPLFYYRKTYGNQFPSLLSLAKRFLCTPATSVPSESAFSIASHLVRCPMCYDSSFTIANVSSRVAENGLN